MTKQCSSCGGFCGKVCQRENVFKPDYNTETVLVEEIQRMAKRIEELENKLKQVQYKYGPMAFQIYLPTTPMQTVNVNNAKLPWVYDQDRASGNVASMWVTPVAQLGILPKEIEK